MADDPVIPPTPPTPPPPPSNMVPVNIEDEMRRSYVDYAMDQACVDGLQLFYEMAATVGAIRTARPLEFL